MYIILNRIRSIAQTRKNLLREGAIQEPHTATVKVNKHTTYIKTHDITHYTRRLNK